MTNVTQQFNELVARVSENFRNDLAQELQIFINPQPLEEEISHEFIPLSQFVEEFYLPRSSIYGMLKKWDAPQYVARHTKHGDRVLWYIHPGNLFEYAFRRKLSTSEKRLLTNAREWAKIKGYMNEKS